MPARYSCDVNEEGTIAFLQGCTTMEAVQHSPVGKVSTGLRRVGEPNMSLAWKRIRSGSTRTVTKSTHLLRRIDTPAQFSPSLGKNLAARLRAWATLKSRSGA